MIITVTLNAAIDKTLAVPNFRLGRRHRAVEQTAMAGGKGVNVARALKSLGQPVIATGIAGGPTGTRIIEHLTEDGILNDFVRIREESRTSTAVVDPTSGEQTEINEHGPHVSEQELELFVDKLLYLAKGADICVFAGSLPRGVPPELYARLVGEMRRLGVTVVLDAEGEPLRLATRAAPDVVSPNELEAEELVGYEFADDDDRQRGIGELVELGAREAIMTLPDGCLALLGHDAPRLYRATLEPLEPVSSVGSGDAFLAGYVAARYGGREPEGCLRFGVACGAESTQHFGAGVLDLREVERLVAGGARGGARDASSRGRLAGARFGCSSALEHRISPWKLRSAGARRAAAHLALTTSRSCLRGARGTLTTSTSPGCSVRTGSSSRCWPRRWTASSLRRPPASSASSAAWRS